MAKTTEKEPSTDPMEAAVSDEKMPEIITIEEGMPSGGGFRKRGELTEAFIEKINDGSAHAIPGIDSKEEKEQWVRKLRYAARLAGRELETKFFPDGPPNGGPAGLYFQGYEPGKAPKRGRRGAKS